MPTFAPGWGMRATGFLARNKTGGCPGKNASLVLTSGAFLCEGALMGPAMAPKRTVGRRKRHGRRAFAGLQEAADAV